MRFAIIMPAYNEEPRIRDTIASAKAVSDSEIIVVDDGSGDATGKAALSSGATLLRLPFNLGYGAAIQTGIKYAFGRGYECAVFMDADGQHDAAFIAALVAPVASGEADVAIGSRFLEKSGYEMPPLKRAGAALLAKAVSFITGTKATDTTSGFQAINKRAMRLYASDAFPPDYPDADVLVMLHRCGMTFVEVPVAMRPNPKKRPMHGGLAIYYYAFKMFLSVFVTLLRKERGCGDKEDGI